MIPVAVSGFLAKQVAVVLTPRGRIKELTGGEQILAAVPRRAGLPAEMLANYERQLKDRYGEDTLRANLEQLTAVFPDKSVTQKPAETRMGSGKGSPEHWVAVVKPGRVMFELAGVSEQLAKEALRLAGQKLPVKTKIVKREADLFES